MASGSVYGRADAGVRIGDILSEGARLWSRMIVPYGPLFLVASLPAEIQRYEQHVHPPHGLAALWQPLAISMVIGVVLRAFVLAGATAMAFEITQNGESSLAGSINRGIGSFLPVLLQLILVGLGVGLGFALLIVPGLIVACMWAVATPALVGEQIGPFASVKRSAALTKGHRWQMFGLFLILAIAALPAVIAGLALTRAGQPLVGSALQLALSAAVGLFGTTATVAAYSALSNASSGFGGRRMAEVF